MSEADPFEVLPFDATHQEGVVSLAEELLCREYGVQADLSGDPDLLGFVEQRGYRRVLLELQPHMEDTVKRCGRYGFEPVDEQAALPRPGRFMAINLPGAG